jgi:hypothetical protein
MDTPSDPLAILRTRNYVALLVLAAVIGAPISAAAWGFLALVSSLGEGSSPISRRRWAWALSRCGGQSHRSPSPACSWR